MPEYIPARCLYPAPARDIRVVSIWRDQDGTITYLGEDGVYRIDPATYYPNRINER